MASPDSPGPRTDEPARPPRGRTRPRGTFRIGRLAGADVLVSSSWFLVAGLIAVVMAPRVEQVRPGLGLGTYVAGFVFAVVLYLSVLVHEASHAYAARHYGYPVSSITLHFLGGMTAIEAEAARPREELVIAVVGPISSLAVGGAAFGLWFVTPEGLPRLAVEALAGANLLVGLLNLVPGLPLDGGRVLKAVVWGAGAGVHTATLVAGWAGRAVAVLVLAWPLFVDRVLGWDPSLLDLVLAVVVAGFLWTGASAATGSARVRRRLPELVARDLARRTLTVAADLPVDEAVRRAQEDRSGSIVTVAPDGRPEGIVNEAALLAVPEERRPWVPISAVARGLEQGLVLPVDIAGEDLVLAISRTPAAEYLLLDADGSVHGVLTTADVDAAFRRVTA